MHRNWHWHLIDGRRLDRRPISRHTPENIYHQGPHSYYKTGRSPDLHLSLYTVALPIFSTSNSISTDIKMLQNEIPSVMHNPDLRITPPVSLLINDWPGHFRHYSSLYISTYISTKNNSTLKINPKMPLTGSCMCGSIGYAAQCMLPWQATSHITRCHSRCWYNASGTSRHGSLPLHWLPEGSLFFPATMYE